MRTSGNPSPKDCSTLPGISTRTACIRASRKGWRASRQSRRTGGNVLFYLSTQPSQYARVAQGIGAAGLHQGSGWRRLVVEKPFGHDLASSRELSDELHKVFPESSIYRIDHYLGKETVQNILAFRFGNGIFEPLWNREYVDHVQITAAESIGVEGRGAFYQEVGALVDMVQNHLLQVMATVAMEPSASFQANSVRDERSKLLRSIKKMTSDEIRANTVPGQYGPARIGTEDVPGFRQEPGVDPNSRTPTYAACTFFVDNWRWAGVPVLCAHRQAAAESGLPRSRSSFSAAPLNLFGEGEGDGHAPNLLILRIQPEEGISLKFHSKRPGDGMKLRPVSMISTTARASASARPRLMRRCCSMPSWATPRCIRARIWWKRAGKWSSPS
jgi:glucose-6-phosphate 1-dehydrogenase